MNEQKRRSERMASRDAFWVLAVGGQAGLMLAGPVLVGLVVGYLLDRQFGALPWITVFFTLVGIVTGPILVYRWVTTTVRDHLGRGQR